MTPEWSSASSDRRLDRARRRPIRQRTSEEEGGGETGQAGAQHAKGSAKPHAAAEGFQEKQDDGHDQQNRPNRHERPPFHEIGSKTLASVTGIRPFSSAAVERFARVSAS